jgi:hypothetical protein
MAITSCQAAGAYRRDHPSDRRSATERGSAMSMILTRQRSETKAETKPADEAVSPSMVVLACIWAALLAYFAIHAALN